MWTNTSYLSHSTQKLILLFLNQNICCGYSKEPSQLDGSFEHPKHVLKLMGKKKLNFTLKKVVYLNLCGQRELQTHHIYPIVPKN